MGTQFEGFIAMMVVALVGGGVAFGVSHSDSAVLHATFAYIGSHLVFAILFLLPTVALMVALNKDDEEPKHAFALSALTIVILPAICAGILLSQFMLPALDEPLANTSMWIGAIATPLLIFGIGGSILESILTRKHNGANKSLDTKT